jgi:Tol biopolymer transport system component
LLTSDGQRQGLLDCGSDLCRSPVPQPGGRWLAYERLPARANLEETELWLLDLMTGETRPAPTPSELVAAGFSGPLGRYARWSPDGRLLALYRPDAHLIVVYDLSADPLQSVTSVPANLETMAGWSADGRRLAYTELAFGQTQPHEHVDETGTVISHTRPSLYNHVVVVDVEAGHSTDLSEGLEVSEGRPAWHPRQDLLAVARTATGSGRQIWLVPLDGRPETQLTDDPFYDHTALTWAPDGRQLAFMRLPRADGSSTPTIMIYDFDSGAIQPLAEGAFLPGWWP